jgi:hypothetical protein
MALCGLIVTTTSFFPRQLSLSLFLSFCMSLFALYISTLSVPRYGSLSLEFRLDPSSQTGLQKQTQY